VCFKVGSIIEYNFAPDGCMVYKAAKIAVGPVALIIGHNDSRDNSRSSLLASQVEVETTGWVGVGFSPNGNMPGSDIIILWVKDGVAYLQARKPIVHSFHAKHYSPRRCLPVLLNHDHFVIDMNVLQGIFCK